MDTTVVKGLKLLEALASATGPRTLTELGNQCGMSKSNAHRLLGTLEACGYIRRVADARSYEPTLRLWEMGVRVFSRLDLRAVAVPHLRELAAVTEETVHLSVFDRGEVIYIDKVDGIHAVRTYVNIGDRSPAYCSSTGKAMLAHMPEETVRAVGSNIQRFTDKTVSSLEELQAHLRRIREQGYSVTSGEWRAGVLGFARAIMSPSGQVIGAIGVAGPEERMRQTDLQKFVDAVLTAASRIERALGFGDDTATSGDIGELRKTRRAPARAARAAG